MSVQIELKSDTVAKLLKIHGLIETAIEKLIEEHEKLGKTAIDNASLVGLVGKRIKYIAKGIIKQPAIGKADSVCFEEKSGVTITVRTGGTPRFLYIRPSDIIEVLE